MKIKKIKIYDFAELSDKSKQIAIDKWYEDEDYPFLSEQLRDSLLYLLKENKIKIQDNDALKLYYSLSNCQGDGVCFIGKFKWKQYNITIVHCYRWYHKRSTNIEIETLSGNMGGKTVYDNFKEIYYNICESLEKEGYGIVEYRMGFNEFQELCESNKYTFLGNGIMESL